VTRGRGSSGEVRQPAYFATAKRCEAKGKGKAGGEAVTAGGPAVRRGRVVMGLFPFHLVRLSPTGYVNENSLYGSREGGGLVSTMP
jgi:hypothetical protein